MDEILVTTPSPERATDTITTGERGDIRSATPGETDGAAAVVLLAFAGDPFVRHWFADPLAYVTHFPRVVEGYAGRAVEHGTAHVVEGFAGAALWLPPGVDPDDEAIAVCLEQGVPEEKHADLFAVADRMSATRPKEPHWFLPLIGVQPGHQRRGVGWRLMHHALRRVDRDGLPAYLEATSPMNVPLYERLGFERLGTIQAGDSAPLVPMLRRPRA